MDRLLRGLSKFQREIFPQKKHLFRELAGSQSPEVLFITCADSRIVPDLITQSNPGDLFICRNAGNIVPPYGEMTGGVSATIEYAVVALGVKHIIICGHTDCGAMHGVMKPEKVQKLPTVAAWLRHGDLAREIVRQKYPDLKPEDTLPVLTQYNVVAQLDHLRTHPSVAARVATGKLEVHGWYYHIESGVVEAYDAEQGRFVTLDGIDAPPGTVRTRPAAEVSA
jgi:carbonic anhydrase